MSLNVHRRVIGPMNEAFRQRVLGRQAVIAVIGLGYVGLPLAMGYAKAGYRTIGFDVSEERVRTISDGGTYLMDVPASGIAEQVRAGRLTATKDPDRLRDVDVLFVCVPTPFDRAKAPDLTYVEAAARTIASILRKDQLVLLESTTYPGTTQEVLVPILEATGLRAGEDFFVAFSPERIDPGNRQFTIENTPKVVGGIDAESTERAALVLEQVVQRGAVHRVSDPRVAEMTKLLENTFRAVNIALVNELAMLCDRMGIDVWEVIEAARTKPYGFMPFYPGPGVGGHCIPVDPYYLSWKAREFDFSTKFIEIAAEINLAMPFFTVDKIRRALRDAGRPLDGAHILALGAAFKRDVDDARNSSAVRVIEILGSEGAIVEYHDPYIPEIRINGQLHGRTAAATTLRSVDLTDERLAAADLVVILVGHGSIDYSRVVERAHVVFDAVNATGNKATARHIVRL